MYLLAVSKGLHLLTALNNLHLLVILKILYLLTIPIWWFSNSKTSVAPCGEWSLPPEEGRM